MRVRERERERECSGLGRGHKGSDFVILRRSIAAPTPVSPALKFVDDQNQNKKLKNSKKFLNEEDEDEARARIDF